MEKNYCSACKRLSENLGRCSFCGKKRLNVPEPNDPVFLIRKAMPLAGIVEQILEREEIPFMRSGGSAGIAMQMIFSTSGVEYEYYVPLQAQERAVAVVGEFFGE